MKVEDELELSPIKMSSNIQQTWNLNLFTLTLRVLQKFNTA